MSKVVKRFLRTCERYAGRECAELQQATSEFLDAARRNPELLSETRQDFEQLAPAAAAWLALTHGTAAEVGFAPELVAAQLLPAFDTWLTHLPKGVEGEPPPTAFSALSSDNFRPARCSSESYPMPRLTHAFVRCE